MNVVSIRGQTIGDELRELADRADKGELKAFAMVWIPDLNHTNTLWRNPVNYGHLLLSGTHLLQLEMAHVMLENACDPQT